MRNSLNFNHTPIKPPYQTAPRWTESSENSVLDYKDTLLSQTNSSQSSYRKNIPTANLFENHSSLSSNGLLSFNPRGNNYIESQGYYNSMRKQHCKSQNSQRLPMYEQLENMSSLSENLPLNNNNKLGSKMDVNQLERIQQNCGKSRHKYQEYPQQCFPPSNHFNSYSIEESSNYKQHHQIDNSSNFKRQLNFSPSQVSFTKQQPRSNERRSQSAVRISQIQAAATQLTQEGQTSQVSDSYLLAMEALQDKLKAVEERKSAEILELEKALVEKQEQIVEIDEELASKNEEIKLQQTAIQKQMEVFKALEDNLKEKLQNAQDQADNFKKEIDILKLEIEKMRLIPQSESKSVQTNEQGDIAMESISASELRFKDLEKELRQEFCLKEQEMQRTIYHQEIVLATKEDFINKLINQNASLRRELQVYVQQISKNNQNDKKNMKKQEETEQISRITNQKMAAEKSYFEDNLENSMMMERLNAGKMLRSSEIAYGFKNQYIDELRNDIKQGGIKSLETSQLRNKSRVPKWTSQTGLNLRDLDENHRTQQERNTSMMINCSEELSNPKKRADDTFRTNSQISCEKGGMQNYSKIDERRDNFLNKEQSKYELEETVQNGLDAERQIVELQHTLECVTQEMQNEKGDEFYRQVLGTKIQDLKYKIECKQSFLEEVKQKESQLALSIFSSS